MNVDHLLLLPGRPGVKVSGRFNIYVSSRGHESLRRWVLREKQSTYESNRILVRIR